MSLFRFQLTLAAFLRCKGGLCLLGSFGRYLCHCRSSTECPQASRLLLRNSCPYTTYPTFSFPPKEDSISPSTNSSPHRTDTLTHPHSSLMPRISKTPVRFNNRYVFFFHRFRLDPFHSSTGPSVHWSPFSSSYVFPFRIRSYSTSAMQHRSSVPFPLSTPYDSLFRFLIGSAKW